MEFQPGNVTMNNNSYHAKNDIIIDTLMVTIFAFSLIAIFHLTKEFFFEPIASNTIGLVIPIFFHACSIIALGAMALYSLVYVGNLLKAKFNPKWDIIHEYGLVKVVGEVEQEEWCDVHNEMLKSAPGYVSDPAVAIRNGCPMAAVPSCKASIKTIIKSNQINLQTSQ
jgi:hypothetical protein